MASSPSEIMATVYICIYIYDVCVCMFIYKKEREKKREREKNEFPFSSFAEKMMFHPNLPSFFLLLFISVLSLFLYLLRKVIPS